MRVRAGAPRASASVDTFDTGSAHQPFHTFATNTNVSAESQLGPDTRRAVGAAGLTSDLEDRLGQPGVSAGPPTPIRLPVPPLAKPDVDARRGDALNPIGKLSSVRVLEPKDHLTTTFTQGDQTPRFARQDHAPYASPGSPHRAGVALPAPVSAAPEFLRRCRPVLSTEANTTSKHREPRPPVSRPALAAPSPTPGPSTGTRPETVQASVPPFQDPPDPTRHTSQETAEARVPREVGAERKRGVKRRPRSRHSIRAVQRVTPLQTV